METARVCKKITYLPLPTLSTPINCLEQQPGMPLRAGSQPYRLHSDIPTLQVQHHNANTRSFPDADICSDHDIVLTNIKLKLKTKRFRRSTGT